MTRRALVVAYCFPPNGAIGTMRTVRLVSHLARTGWDVDVLTAREDAYLPGTTIDRRLLELVPPSVRVVRTGAIRGLSRMGRWVNALRPTRVSRPTSTLAEVTPAASAPARPGLKRVIEGLCALPDKDVGWYLPAVRAARRALRATPPQVVFSSAPPWTSHLIAKSLASNYGCRWVADFRDPWVHSPWARYPAGTVSTLAARLEAMVFRSASDVVFTTSAAKAKYVSCYPAAAERFHVVPNGCDPSEFPSDPLPSEPSRFVLLHAGSLYGGRSPMPLLRAVAALVGLQPELGSRLSLRFLGVGADLAQDLGNQCAALGLGDHVSFAPRVDRETSLREMQQAAALLILQGGTAMAIPGKFYEYLAAGRPVFAVCERGEMTELIDTHRLGVTADFASEDEIARQLERLLRSAPGHWARAERRLFDGRLRAEELGAILGSSGGAS